MGGTPSFKPVTEWSINESDAVTAVSDFLAAETGRQLSLRRPIDVVPNFIDPDRHGSELPSCIPGTDSDGR